LNNAAVIVNIFVKINRTIDFNGAAISGSDAERVSKYHRVRHRSDSAVISD